jgi:hypothetical protein
MLVKVRLPRGAASRRIDGKHAPFLSGLSGLVMLLAFSCLMLAVWRLTSDLGWTQEFVISDGFLSHWQVWMALTIAIGAVGMRLNKFSQPFAPEESAQSELAQLEAVTASEMEEEQDLLGPRMR